MKKVVFFIALIALMLPNYGKAQSGFYAEFIAGCGYGITKISDNGETVDVKDYNPDDAPKWWPLIKQKNMSNEWFMSGKFGWDFAYMPMSVYISLKFSYRDFFSKFPDDEQFTHNNLFKILPGFGVRLPIKDMLRSVGHCPVFQVGADFDSFTRYKGIYGKQKDQLKAGVNTIYGLGWQFGYNLTVLAEFELPHHNLLNQDFTPDNGATHPYAKVDSKMYVIYLAVAAKF